MHSVQFVIRFSVCAAAGLALLFAFISAQTVPPSSGGAIFSCPADLVTRVNSSYLLCIRDVMNGTSGQSSTQRPDEDQLLKSNVNGDVFLSDEEYESEEYKDSDDRELRNSGGYSMAQQRRWARTAMYSCMVRRLMKNGFVQTLAADCSSRGTETRKNRCIMRRLRRSCPRAFAPITIGASLLNRY